MVVYLKWIVLILIIGFYFFIGFRAIKEKQFTVGTIPFTRRKIVRTGFEAQLAGYYVIITITLPVLIGLIAHFTHFGTDIIGITFLCLWLISATALSIYGVSHRRK